MLNGSDGVGFASRKKDELALKGITVTSIGDAPVRSSYGALQWFDLSGGSKPQTAKEVGRYARRRRAAALICPMGSRQTQTLLYYLVMELIKSAARRSKLSDVAYVVLNLRLAGAVFGLTVAFTPPYLAYLLIILSKWRVFAVRPRFWLANMRGITHRYACWRQCGDADVALGGSTDGAIADHCAVCGMAAGYQASLQTQRYDYSG